MAAMTGLEVWLLGTPTDVNTAVTALTRTNRVLYAGPAHAMSGCDAGRVRRYLRLAVPMPGRVPTPTPNKPGLFAA